MCTVVDVSSGCWRGGGGLVQCDFLVVERDLVVVESGTQLPRRGHKRGCPD